MLREVKISPDGRLAAVTHNLARFQLPTTQLDRGWMNTAALTLIDVATLSVINTVLLDDLDRGAANPWAIGWAPDGRTLVVTHAGTHDLSVIDVPGAAGQASPRPRRDPIRPARYDPYAASRVAADVPNDLSFLVGVRTRGAADRQRAEDRWRSLVPSSSWLTTSRTRSTGSTWRRDPGRPRRSRAGRPRRSRQPGGGRCSSTTHRSRFRAGRAVPVATRTTCESTA